MTRKKQNLIVAVHIALLAYAVLFAAGIYLDGTFPLLWFLLEVKPIVPIGNISLLFVNVPLSVVTLVLRGKGKFDGKRSFAVLILSVINILVSIAAWPVAIWVLIGLANKFY